MQYTSYPIVKSAYGRVWKKYCGFLDLSLSNYEYLYNKTEVKL